MGEFGRGAWDTESGSRSGFEFGSGTGFGSSGRVMGNRLRGLGLGAGSLRGLYLDDGMGGEERNLEKTDMGWGREEARFALSWVEGWEARLRGAGQVIERARRNGRGGRVELGDLGDGVSELRW